MLQLPLGVTGNITQLMTGMKGTQGLRPGTPLLLSQVFILQLFSQKWAFHILP